MQSPEELAREKIDKLLAECGWIIQNRSNINLSAATGIALREGLLKSGEADYLLFADEKIIGTVEAKPEGYTLIGVEEQSGKYGKGVAENKRRSLVQMATGSGKTYTAANLVYRLIKLAGARRILFLVDRGNLGDQTLKEFQQFVTPDDGRKFTELYNIQHLQSSKLDLVSRVCISTIQRLYSMLKGEELDPELDEASGERIA